MRIYIYIYIYICTYAHAVSTAFHEVPLPALLSHHVNSARTRKLEQTITELETKISSLTLRLELAETQLREARERCVRA